jgi:hypothetical protein
MPMKMLRWSRYGLRIDGTAMLKLKRREKKAITQNHPKVQKR